MDWAAAWEGMMAVAWEAETVVALEVAGWVAEHGCCLTPQHLIMGAIPKLCRAAPDSKENP